MEIVIQKNSDDLLSYLRRRVENSDDAADLLGHVFLALWEGSARVPTAEKDARMWCFGIARNLLREHYRRGKSRLALADRLRDRLHTDATQHVGAADVTAEERIRATQIRRAVACLDERSRELVILVHWDGFTIAQASRLLAMNESTARTRHSRALRRLEHLLGESAAPSSAGKAQSGIQAR